MAEQIALPEGHGEAAGTSTHASDPRARTAGPEPDAVGMRADVTGSRSDAAGSTADVTGPKPDAAVVRDALGVGTAVGLSGFAFGVTAAGSGLSLLQTCALSLAVFTGASQFALVGALAAGGNPYTAAAGAFFLGVRNSFYGLRLSQLLALPRALRPFAAQWVIDETTAVTLSQPTRRAARIGFAVTGLSLYVLWNLTTLLGALGASRCSGVVPAASGQASWASSRRCASAAASDSAAHSRPVGAPPGTKETGAGSRSRREAGSGAVVTTAGGVRRPARAPCAVGPSGCLPGGPPARFVSRLASRPRFASCSAGCLADGFPTPW
ncbi:AzlC family ABC transporter permease [Streptomyces sp. NPDC057545]|uniref:AzlC family ABC transporter permease n=1 Tax=Streptomyces sp. NPDC057545 TaxID=3346164 RepID=UPI00368ED80C